MADPHAGYIRDRVEWTSRKDADFDSEVARPRSRGACLVPMIELVIIDHLMVALLTITKSFGILLFSGCQWSNRNRNQRNRKCYGGPAAHLSFQLCSMAPGIRV